ncbi:MAG TPA: glucosamine-6-phosphate deaminase [Rectinemataceae bacterium]
MNICVYENPKIMGTEAAAVGARAIREAIAARGAANIILATGASQFTMLERLVREPGIDWSRVTCFHLDEYVGMSIEHPASFRTYLRERFADKLPTLGEFNYIEADAKPLSAEIERLNAKIAKHPIDVAFIGIGENGHLAFNDPPADFDTESPYIVVDLDEKCRLQQVGEGWFKGMAEVPKQAVSMSVRHIMKSAMIVCSVPDARKAEAVDMALNAPISPAAPCSILRRHPCCHLMLDRAAASKVIRSADD